MNRFVRYLGRIAAAVAVAGAVVFASATGSAFADTIPVIQSVSVAGSVSNPSITINGQGFGTIPANTGQPTPYTGLDYGSQLGLSDLSAGWNAGQTDNGVGITVSNYTSSTIEFGLGSYYSAGGFTLATGDQFEVLVKGVTCTGTVGYPTTVACTSDTTTISSSSLTSAFGQDLTLTATVSGTGSTTSIPSGSVSFYDGTTNLGSAALDASGSANLQIDSLSVGSHNIKAIYSGDSIFLPSTSTVLTQVVNKAATSTSLTSNSANVTDGQPVTLAATITVTPPGTSAVAPPTGTVTFTDGGTALGMGTVSTANGVTSASITTMLPLGTGQTIAASYGGDGNFTGSTGTLAESVTYKFGGFLPPASLGKMAQLNQTIPLKFVLYDFGGAVVQNAEAHLLVNGNPAVPQGSANSNDSFSFVNGHYQYQLKLRNQGISADSTVHLTVVLNDGSTHSLTITVR